MSLGPLEQHVLSYWSSGQAVDLNIATRWYPYSEMILIIEDKIAVATRKFGPKVKACAKAAATAFLDAMIAKGAWETKANEFGGNMHQFQLGTYTKVLAEMNAADPIAAEAATGGDTFWADTFAKLTS